MWTKNILHKFDGYVIYIAVGKSREMINTKSDVSALSLSLTDAAWAPTQKTEHQSEEPLDPMWSRYLCKGARLGRKLTVTLSATPQQY